MITKNWGENFNQYSNGDKMVEYSYNGILCRCKTKNKALDVIEWSLRIKNYCQERVFNSILCVKRKGNKDLLW